MEEELLKKLLKENKENKASSNLIISIEENLAIIESLTTSTCLPELKDILIRECRVYGMAQGYTEYVKNKMAKELNISKTALKFLIDDLVKKEVIEVIKFETVTFLNLIKE